MRQIGVTELARAFVALRVQRILWAAKSFDLLSWFWLKQNQFSFSEFFLTAKFFSVTAFVWSWLRILQTASAPKLRTPNVCTYTELAVGMEGRKGPVFVVIAIAATVTDRPFRPHQWGVVKGRTRREGRTETPPLAGKLDFFHRFLERAQDCCQVSEERRSAAWQWGEEGGRQEGAAAGRALEE